MENKKTCSTCGKKLPEEMKKIDLFTLFNGWRVAYACPNCGRLHWDDGHAAGLISRYFLIEGNLIIRSAF